MQVRVTPESGRGQPHSKTLARFSAHCLYREVMEVWVHGEAAMSLPLPAGVKGGELYFEGGRLASFGAKVACDCSGGVLRFDALNAWPQKYLFFVLRCRMRKGWIFADQPGMMENLLAREAADIGLWHSFPWVFGVGVGASTPAVRRDAAGPQAVWR